MCFRWSNSLCLCALVVTIATCPLLGCGSSSESSDPGGSPGSGGTDDGAGPVETFSGVFTLDLAAEQTLAGVITPAHTTLTGQIESGPPVPTLLWEATSTEGECELLEPYAPFCEVDCGSGVCVADDVCRDDPDTMDAGTATLTGVELADGGSEVELLAVLGKYQLPGASGVSYPPATEGARLTLTADGIEANPVLPLAPGFTVETTGISPLEITSGETVSMEREQPTTVTWTPADDPRASRIFVEVDISHHGGQKGQIDCEIEDSGSLTIPATLITGLINLGVAGFPDLKIARRAVGTTETDEMSVTFQVQSQVTLPVELPGFASCSEDLPCPDDLTCNNDVLLCQ